MKKILSILLVLTLTGVLLTGCLEEPTVKTLDTSSEENSENETDEALEPSDTETTETEEAVTDDDMSDTDDETMDADNSDQETVSSESETENELPLPDALPDGRGNMISFSDYEGKLLFVNFFGTWCTYCMQEMPDFQKFTEEYSDQATIVIVNALETEGGKTAEDIVAWYDGNDYTMPMVIDEDKSKTMDFYGAIQGFPTTFVYDENQIFLGYIPGMMDYAMLEQIVDTYAGQ